MKSSRINDGSITEKHFVFKFTEEVVLYNKV